LCLLGTHIVPPNALQTRSNIGAISVSGPIIPSDLATKLYNYNIELRIRGGKYLKGFAEIISEYLHSAPIFLGEILCEIHESADSVLIQWIGTYCGKINYLVMEKRWRFIWTAASTYMFAANSQNTVWIILFISEFGCFFHIKINIVLASGKNSGTNLVHRTANISYAKIEWHPTDWFVSWHILLQKIFVLMSSFKTI